MIMNDWAIWFFCNICGYSIYIKPNSKKHNDIIDYIEKEKQSCEGTSIVAITGILYGELVYQFKQQVIGHRRAKRSHMSLG